MKINEVMKRTGLSRKAIYVYENHGLFTPKKSPAGYREYSEDDISNLLLIAKLRELDFSLENISELLSVPEETDILMQNHFGKLQTRLSETMNKLAQMQTILYNLPPNGTLSDFARAATIAIPEEQAILSAHTLSEETTPSEARRLTMHIFEAFLDMPLNTSQRWEAWYNLLELMEKVGLELWEGYEDYYGNMTAEERYEDYQLRRNLVVGYTQMTPDEEYNKGEEIISCLKQLVTDDAYAKRWKRYYMLVVYPTLYSSDCFGQAETYFSELSSVYHSYNRKCGEILHRFVLPFLDTEQGKELHAALQERLGSAWDTSIYSLEHFDFFNHTLEQMRQTKTDK